MAKDYEVSYVLGNYLGLGINIGVVEATNEIEAAKKVVPFAFRNDSYIKCKQRVNKPLDLSDFGAAGLIEGFGGDTGGYLRGVAESFKKTAVPYNEFVNAA